MADIVVEENVNTTNVSVTAATPVDVIIGGSLIGPPGIDGAPGPSTPTATAVIQGKQLMTNYNVRDFGAMGDDTTDDTTTIQACIDYVHTNFGGGIVMIPNGTYKITAQLNLHPNMIIQGSGTGSTIIKQYTGNANGIVASDAPFTNITDLTVSNASGSHTSGSGILLTWLLLGNVQQTHLANAEVIGFNIGVNSQTIITSDIQNVETEGCDIGFNFYNGGTSTHISNTYANNCSIGYALSGLVYISFTATACDNSHIAYHLVNCAGISFNGCGNEAGQALSAPNDGRGYFIDSCQGIALYNSWSYQNPSYGVYVTNSSAITIVGYNENSPTGTAINGIFIDTNCARIVLVSPTTQSLNNIQGGSNITTVIGDNGANSTFPGNVTIGTIVSPLVVSGANGELLMSATTDGGDYNLFSSATGVLAIYGSIGATLNVNLLDGYLQLSTLTPTTVPYLDGNSRFASSAVTPTQLGYLSSTTGTTGTNLLVLNSSPTIVTPAITQSATISGTYPRLTMINTQSSQFAGPGLFLYNNQSTMTTQAGVMLYAGINNVGISNGYFAMFTTDYTGAQETQFAFWDFNAHTFTSAWATIITAGNLTLSSGNINVTSGNLTLSNGSATITGSTGALIISASPDGGDFNIFHGVAGTKTLALYGSSTSVLNLNLLDGVLQMGGNTTISNAGVLSNITLDTAGTAVVLKVNGTSLTAVTGTGAVVLATVASLSSLATIGTITSGGLGTGAVIGGVTMTLGSDATGDIYYRAAGGVLTRLAVGTSSQVLIGGTTPSWGAPFSLTTTGTSGAATFSGGTLNIPNYAAGGGMTNPMTTLGDIIYENATPAAARLAGNTTTAKQYLSQTGNGTISAAPAWATIAVADLSGFGTGVATALGVAVGSAGAPVLFNGAGGTPTSLTLTNATGLPLTGLLAAAYATANTASTLAERDANKNLTANAFLNGFTTTATATGTTTMTIASTPVQVWTGTLAQTIKLPTTSVAQGAEYTFINQSTGSLTIQSSGANTILIIGPGCSAFFTAVVATPTTAANWAYQYIGDVVASGKFLTVSNNLTLAGTDGTTMTFPSTSATIARTDAANTFTGIQTVALLNSTNQAASVTTNAATLDINHALQTFTNSSAAAMTITLTTGAVDGQFKEVRIYDFSAVAETITWVNTENSLVTAPTTSNGSTTLPLSVLFQYNGSTSKWRCIAAV